MLNSLSIKNVAVIDSVNLDLSDGLSVLTGETGAGKSIIIDSINMILGARADRELVRHGAEKAMVQAVFDTSAEIEKMLSDNDIDSDGEQLIVTRSLTAEGKSVAKINGTIVPLALLREVSGLLVNIHGQHDNQALLTPSKHIIFLDEYAKNEELLNSYTNLYSKMKEISAALNRLNVNEQEKKQRTDLLEYQINEISAADLSEGEEEDLRNRLEVCRNAEKISSAVSAAYGSPYDSEGSQSAYDGISVAVNALEDISELTPELQNAYNVLSEAMYTIQDTVHDLREFAETVEFDEGELNDIEERLSLILNLKRKYGNSVSEILEFVKKAQEELDGINSSDETIVQLSHELEQIKSKLKTAGEKLSAARKQAAQKLQKQIITALHELNMENTSFEVSVKTEDVFWENGIDEVEFFISTNPGEPLKPLIKIASGGELSRVMLALKSVLADADKVGTLIFDEIDTGVSGAAALKIALKLQEIAQFRQVLCITHLPQLAANADTHYLIEKTVSDGAAHTSVRRLDFDGRIAELSRIIDGGSESGISKEYAKEMLSGNNRRSLS